MQFTVAMEMT